MTRTDGPTGGRADRTGTPPPSRRGLLRLLGAGALGAAGCTLARPGESRSLPPAGTGRGAPTDDVRPADWLAGWAQFRDRFITPAGRVVDVSNKHVSHSEGQGYAMLFAVAANDRDTFDRVWGWTRATLQSRPDDALLSWRWMPDDPDAAGDMGRVDDPNNATDGDLLVAWALTRASQRWSEPSYRSDAVTLAGDILRLTVLERDGVLMMLPGVDGFRRDGAVILNPSYYVFPAIDALGMLTGDAIWQRLSANGADLIQEARFGRWNLPPDWLLVRYQEADPPAETETETAEDAGTDDAAGPAEANAEGAEPDATAGPEPDADPGATADAPAEDTADGPPETDTEANTEADAETGAEAGEPLPRLDLPEGFEPAFGFNAIRIPLNLIWGGRQTPERLEPFITFWGHFDGARFTPSWTDLTKDTVTVYESNPGFQAVFVLTSAAWDDWTLGTVTLPDLGDDADYYASALWLQVGLAREGWV